MVSFALSSHAAATALPPGVDAHGLCPIAAWHGHHPTQLPRAGAPEPPLANASVLPQLKIPKLEHNSSEDMEVAAHEILFLNRKRKTFETAPATPAEMGPPPSYAALSSLAGTPSAASEHPVRAGKFEAHYAIAKCSPLQQPADNLLDEPSPLGLTLKKTPSLLDLISMKLTQGFGDCESAANGEGATAGSVKNRIGKCLAPTGSSHDKLKASNFPASSLRIGSWERLSRYEGDLVAKCYYAKRKLVWEVLDSGLKSKIEIQWSDISAMRASCPDHLPGSLEIEVSRPPLFFRETNPQPRKHTLWQATSDFTGGEATVCMKHELEFPEGILNRHYEKLVQCDPRLKSLVSGTLATRLSARYEQSTAILEGPQKPANELHILSPHDPVNFCGSQHQPSSLASTDRTMLDCHVFASKPEYEMRLAEVHTKDLTSPNSVMHRRDQNGYSEADELHSKEDMPRISRLGPLDFKYLTSGGGLWDNQPPPVGWSGGDARSSERKILDELRYMLLGEPSTTFLTDHQALLFAARVGSMSAVLADEAKELQVPGSRSIVFESWSDNGQSLVKSLQGIETSFDQADEELGSIVASAKDVRLQGLTSSQIEKNLCSSSGKHGSSGDLLVHLPRVASLPQFFEAVSQVPLSLHDPLYQTARTLG